MSSKPLSKKDCNSGKLFTVNDHTLETDFETVVCLGMAENKQQTCVVLHRKAMHMDMSRGREKNTSKMRKASGVEWEITLQKTASTKIPSVTSAKTRDFCAKHVNLQNQKRTMNGRTLNPKAKNSLTNIRFVENETQFLSHNSDEGMFVLRSVIASKLIYWTNLDVEVHV